MVLGAAVAAVAVVATVATLGAAAPAAACALATAVSVTTGLTSAAVYTASAVAVAATFTATTAYVTDIAYASVTGDSPLLNNVFRGNVDAYMVGAAVAFSGTAYLVDISQFAAVCFVAGTPVATESGCIPIELIQPGDLVWAWDEETGDVALKQVVETYVNKTDELTHVYVSGEEIICTPSHPFYSPVKGWTSACKLRAGDILQLVNGEYVVVEKVQHELLESLVKVYNFQVQDYHTYYVATGVLVHNSCNHNSAWNKESLQIKCQAPKQDLTKKVCRAGSGEKTQQKQATA